MRRGVLFQFVMGTFMFIVCVIFMLPSNAKAEEHLIINEVYPNQISDGADTEWAEIFNPINLPINLSDYFLVKITNSGSKYEKQLTETMCPVSGNYYVCNLGTNWLANSGSTLVLKNKDLEIDRVTFGPLSNNAPVPAKGESIGRIPNGYDSDLDFSDFRIIPLTKGGENLLVEPTPSPDCVEISEILPHPENGAKNEFIEIYNYCSDPVDIGGWSLEDTLGSVKKFKIPPGTILLPTQYLAFYNFTTGISLNDDSDRVLLLDPDNTIKSNVDYLKAKIGQSFSKISGIFDWTNNVTPGRENIGFSFLNIAQEIIPISEARKMENEDKVTISGVVTASPGVLSSNSFYIEDDTAGIQVYSSDKSFPNLQSGLRVSVVGVLLETSSERRIKISNPADIIIIDYALSPVTPQFINIADVGEKFEGKIITTEGIVVQTSGSTFIISDGAELKVLIRKSTGIKKPKMKKGDKVRISGIVSQYKNEYRILPFFKDGVKILTSGRLPTSGYDQPINYLELSQKWRLQQNQPMKQEELVINLEKA
ncbi:MAG: lamin tail domain-containing protein [Patescibacteria group bacterium]